MIIRPPAVEPNSQLQLRLCRWAVRASVVRQYQLHRYFPVGLKVLSLGHFAENGPPQKAGPTRARDCRETPEGRRLELVYGILSGPCMI